MLRLLIFIWIFFGFGFVVYGQAAQSTIDSVEIRNFSASVSGEKIIISFSIKNIETGRFITIERSENGKDFETLGILKTTNGGELVKWTDEAPVGGKNIYRIKFENKEGLEVFSSVVESFYQNRKNYKFYPNPVDNILIVRSDQVLEVQIIDANGKPRTSLYKVDGIQTIDVSAIEKGIYYLRLHNLKTGHVTLDRLIKN